VTQEPFTVELIQAVNDWQRGGDGVDGHKKGGGGLRPPPRLVTAAQ